jgi:hypothetical protein
MLEPRNEGGAVLRERRRLQLPKRLHQHPAEVPSPRAHACVRVSSPHDTLLTPTQ